MGDKNINSYLLAFAKMNSEWTFNKLMKVVN